MWTLTIENTENQGKRFIQNSWLGADWCNIWIASKCSHILKMDGFSHIWTYNSLLYPQRKDFKITVATCRNMLSSLWACVDLQLHFSLPHKVRESRADCHCGSAAPISQGLWLHTPTPHQGKREQRRCQWPLSCPLQLCISFSPLTLETRYSLFPTRHRRSCALICWKQEIRGRKMYRDWGLKNRSPIPGEWRVCMVQSGVS